MARSTTGTSKVYSCETISNHKALRAFGEDPALIMLPHSCAGKGIFQLMIVPLIDNWPTPINYTFSSAPQRYNGIC